MHVAFREHALNKDQLNKPGGEDWTFVRIRPVASAAAAHRDAAVSPDLMVWG
jgi:hypothetical protein